jgi:signal transduction histidine kinase/CheY-like chemotaxis protein
MKLKLTERAARLAQIKRALDQLSDGQFSKLPTSEDEEVGSLIDSFNRLSAAVSLRETAMSGRNTHLALALSRTEKLLDASNDGIAFIDCDGRFQFVNRRFTEMLGLRPGQLTAILVSETRDLWQSRLANPESLHHVLSPQPHDQSDGTEDVVDQTIQLDGHEPGYAQAYSAPVLDDDGSYTGRIVSLHDNTREMELDKLKSDFISVVSHELRTPLTSIKGYTDLMLSGQTGEINDIQKEFLGILRSSATRLGNLINDILDLSRIEAGKMEVKHEPVNYLAVMSDLLKLMKASADEKEIDLDISVPLNLPLIAGDVDKISQVVSNLVSNAIKYTPEGGWIKISIELAPDSTVRTCVADSGIGISAADQKMLFQKFFRADNSLTRQAGGTGLGLGIVRSIIEMLGGAVWVQSEEGRGSRFYFTLPLFAEDRSHQLSGAHGIADRALGLIMLVDETTNTRETVQHALHRRGYGVVNAVTVQDAAQKARRQKPDVVLVNMLIEQCTGLSVIEALRADPSTEDVPVIAFSLQREASEDQVAFGTVSMSTNPIDTDAIVEQMMHKLIVLDRPLSALIVAIGTETFASAVELQTDLEKHNINSSVATSAYDAVSAVVASIPDIILFELDGEGKDYLPRILNTLKSESDLAKLPIILLTNELNAAGVHYHLGLGVSTETAVVEYLYEQITTVLRIAVPTTSAVTVQPLHTQK